MEIGEILDKFTQDVKHKRVEKSDKTRYDFTIDKKVDAIACFQEISKRRNVMNNRVSLHIFYVKPGKLTNVCLRPDAFESAANSVDILSARHFLNY